MPLECFSLILYVAVVGDLDQAYINPSANPKLAKKGAQAELTSKIGIFKFITYTQE